MDHSFQLPAAFQPYATQRRWVVWRMEKNKQGKPTKVPYRPDEPTRRANAGDPSTWSDAATAIEVAVSDGFDGIGMELLDGELAAFDLDDCVEEGSGEIQPWVKALIDRAESYTERTPSGKGLRIIGIYFGLLEKGIKRPVPAGNGASVELYPASPRYIIVTGDRLDGTPDAFADITKIVDAAFAELNAAKANGKAGTKEAGDEVKTNFKIESIEPDDPRLKSLGAEWIELGTKGTGLKGIDKKYKGDRSDAVMAFCCECLRHGICDDLIASCLIHWEIGEHVRDQSNAERALSRVIARAKEFVADSDLFKMNEKFCVLPINGKTRVVTWGDDPDFPGRQVITMTSSLHDFRGLYDKYAHTYQEDGETKIVRKGSWWIANTGRRQFDGGMRFVPTSDSDVINGDTLNLWTGFKVAARRPEGKSGAAGCQLFLNHGLKVICSGNEEHFDYLIRREAFIAQKRTRSEVSVALRTEAEGTGKGMWERLLNHLYGVHAMQIQHPDHVVGKFNPHLETLLRVTADEALFALNPLHRNTLYYLITEDGFTIEPKFVNPYKAKSYINIDIVSNADHFVPVSGFARRFFIPTVSSERANDIPYFKEMMTQFYDEGGAEALLYHLLREIDIRDFNVRAVPKTAMLAEQAAYSRRGVDLLVEIACSTAIAPCQQDSHPPGFSVTIGYQQQYGFDYFIDHHRDKDLSRLGSLKVKRSLAKDWGCVTGKATRSQQQGHRASGIMWPPLKELREKFEQKYGKQDWLSDDQEWQREAM
jgi:hypothetical protein